MEKYTTYFVLRFSTNLAQISYAVFSALFLSLPIFLFAFTTWFRCEPLSGTCQHWHRKDATSSEFDLWRHKVTPCSLIERFGGDVWNVTTSLSGNGGRLVQGHIGCCVIQWLSPIQPPPHPPSVYETNCHGDCTFFLSNVFETSRILAMD